MWDLDTPTTCEPLLVGGDVIGSVLVTHARPLTDGTADRIKTTVIQAAPVLANLRNLALAEFRANNDSLTGCRTNARPTTRSNGWSLRRTGPSLLLPP